MFLKKNSQSYFSVMIIVSYYFASVFNYVSITISELFNPYLKQFNILNQINSKLVIACEHKLANCYINTCR